MKPDSHSPHTPKRSRWKRRLKGLLFAGVALITLLFLVLAVENYRARLAWDHYRAQLEARGERFDYEAYRTPPIPDEQNFAAIPYFQDATNAGNRVDATWPWPRGKWITAQLTDWIGWQVEIRGGPDERSRRYGFSQPSSPELLELRALPEGEPIDDFYFLLESRQSTLDQIREAAGRPYARFDFDFMNFSDAALPVLGRIKSASLVFQSMALAELTRENPSAALDHWKVMMRLADAIGSEPLLIFHLVQIATLDQSIQPVWEGLARMKWTENELIEIERGLAQVNLSGDLARTYRGERNFSLVAMDIQLGALRVPSAAFVNRNKLGLARMHQDYFLPPLDPENRGFDLELMQELERAGEEHYAQVRQRMNWLPLPKRPYEMMAAGLYPAMGMAGYKSLRMQTTVELARTAVALERWRMAQGEYPESLEPLVPEFLPEIPIDFGDGNPLRYRPIPEGRFILYSIGLDGEDHGGKTWEDLGRQSQDRETGDWVWKYPEVQ
jgi:hypothetical protein